MPMQYLATHANLSHYIGWSRDRYTLVTYSSTSDSFPSVLVIIISSNEYFFPGVGVGGVHQAIIMRLQVNVKVITIPNVL